MDTVILQFFQNIRNPFLTVLFGFFTFQAEGALLMVATYLLYWLSEKKTGERILFTVFTTLPLNTYVKNVVSRPRPYVAGIVTRVEVDNLFISTMDLGDYVSFPSGHAQTAASFLTAINCKWNKRWAWLLSGVWMFFILCSRLYFGVHYPSDVLVGLLFGIAVALVWELIFTAAYKARYFVLSGTAVLSLCYLFFAAPHNHLQAAGMLAGFAVFVPLCDLFLHDKLPKGNRKLWRILIGFLCTGATYLLTLLLPQGEAFTLLQFFLLAGASTAGARALFQLFHV